MDLAAFKLYTEPLSHLATIAGACALLYAFRGWKVSQKSAHHDVIASCSARFQELVDDITSHELDGFNPQKARQYLDLCNEELFYFENDYLPRPVVVEWLDGMLSFLPLRYKGAEFNSEPGPLNLQIADSSTPFFQREELWNLPKSYPRLNYIFSVTPEEAAEINKIEEGKRKREIMLKVLLVHVKTYPKQSVYGSLLRKPWYLPF